MHVCVYGVLAVCVWHAACNKPQVQHSVYIWSDLHSAHHSAHTRSSEGMYIAKVVYNQKQNI